jgi:hypothetical protein
MQNTVTQEQIDQLLERSNIIHDSLFGKTTRVTIQLENGFVITESSSCVDPSNYDDDIGYEVCIERIKNKLWELEGYKLQDQLREEYLSRPDAVIPKKDD